MLDIILYLCVRQRTMGSVKLSVLYLEVAKEAENLSVFSPTVRDANSVDASLLSIVISPTTARVVC
jgi:hypothetical protein